MPTTGREGLSGAAAAGVCCRGRGRVPDALRGRRTPIAGMLGGRRALAATLRTEVRMPLPVKVVVSPVDAVSRAVPVLSGDAVPVADAEAGRLGARLDEVDAALSLIGAIRQAEAFDQTHRALSQNRTGMPTRMEGLFEVPKAFTYLGMEFAPGMLLDRTVLNDGHLNRYLQGRNIRVLDGPSVVAASYGFHANPSAAICWQRQQTSSAAAGKKRQFVGFAARPPRTPGALLDVGAGAWPLRTSIEGAGAGLSARSQRDPIHGQRRRRPVRSRDVRRIGSARAAGASGAPYERARRLARIGCRPSSGVASAVLIALAGAARPFEGLHRVAPLFSKSFVSAYLGVGANAA